MGYRAPASPGTEGEGNWYVPVIGMGAGSIIGSGMKSLQQKWAAVHQLWTGKSTLPEVADLASMTGGINTGSTRAIKEAGSNFSHAEDFAPLINPSLAKPTVANRGGMVPDKDVMDRVMNAGLRDKILGFGEKTKPKDYMGLKEIRKDFDDYYGK